jgi:hypothetical protein
MIENQRSLLLKNDESIRIEQNEKNILRERVAALENQILILQTENDKNFGIIESYLGEIKIKSEESSKFRLKTEKLLEENSLLAQELMKYQNQVFELMKERESFQLHLHEFQEREHMLNELYLRIQEGKVETHKIVAEKENLIHSLEKKILELEKVKDINELQKGKQIEVGFNLILNF